MSFFIQLILIVIAVLSIVGFFAIWQNKNKEKRLSMISEDEKMQDEEINRDLAFGNDRFRMYFDRERKKVMLMRIRTEGIMKRIIDDFEFSGKALTLLHDNGSFVVYSVPNRVLLSGKNDSKGLFYDLTDLDAHDMNDYVVPASNIRPYFCQGSINVLKKNNTTREDRTLSVLVDENRGIMAIVVNGVLDKVFNYVDGSKLSKKTGDVSTIISKQFGNYIFFFDELLNVVIIVTEGFRRVIFYHDILSVKYEEHGDRDKIYAIRLIVTIKTVSSTEECIINFLQVDSVLKLESDLDKDVYERLVTAAQSAKSMLEKAQFKKEDKTVEQDTSNGLNKDSQDTVLCSGQQNMLKDNENDNVDWIID